MALPLGLGSSMPSLDDCPQAVPPTPSRVAGLPRNRWLLCVGITGWLQSECPAALRRNAQVGEVAPHHRGQTAMLVGEPPAAMFAALIIDRSHCAGKSALGRHLPNHGLAVPGPSPDMGQTQEVEVGPIRFRMART